MKKVILIIMITTLLLGQWATIVDATSAGAFIMRPVGARSLGMGSAVVAAAQDGSMGYWNPAGLAYQNRSEVHSMQGTILGDVEYTYLGYNRLRDSKYWDLALSGTWINTRVEGIKEASYLEGNGKLTGNTFAYEGNAYILSAAKALDKRLAIGGNIKYIKEVLYNNSAAGVGADLGILYRINKRTNIGIVYHNIMPTELAWDTNTETSEAIPFNTIVGIYHRITDEFALACDIHSRSDRGLSAKYGAEYIFNKYFALRAGFEQSRFLLGTSIAYNAFGIHYSFATEPVGAVVDSKHYLSLSYVFEEKEDLIEPIEIEKKIEIKEPMPATSAIEEIPLVEYKKDIIVKQMTVKKINGNIITEVEIENNGDVTTDVRTAVSIYDANMQLLKVFTVQKATLLPGDHYTHAFNWQRTSSLPYGEYYFKTRVLYNGQEKLLMKKVIRN